MLEADNVSVSYDGVKVLSGHSLSVAPGELVALVGDNGCGKSSLARALCAVRLVDEGRVVVDGHDPSVSELERLHVRQLVGYVQQDPFDQLVCASVFDEVAFGPRNMGLDGQEVVCRVTEALTAVGLAGYEARETARLSGGEQQRLALAGVLAMEPRYLVLDEPTAQLDPTARAQMRALFAELAHDRGIGVILVTHDAHEIALADRVVRLGDAPASELSPAADAAKGSCGQIVLDVRGVLQAYEGRKLLSGANLSVRAGEVVLLGGASGAGKTTLALIAAGLFEPQAGVALVDGKPSVPGCVGLAFQNPEAQCFLNTVFDEIAYAPRNVGVDEARVAMLVHASAARVGLAEELLDRHPMELSGGQARRVGLAATLALDAPAYIFDEPSAGLDTAGRAFAHRLVRELASAGKAVVVISHDVEEWLPVADRSLRVEAGAVVPSDLVASTSQDSWAPTPDGQMAQPGVSVAAPGSGAVELGASPAATDSRAVETSASEAAPGRRAAELRTPVAATGSRAAENAASAESGGQAVRPGALADEALFVRIDARVKIILLLVVCAGLFAASSPLALSPWLAALVLCLAASRVSVRSLVRSMKPIVIVLLFVLVANVLVIDGHADISLVGPAGITLSGMARAGTAALRIVLLVGFALVVAATTTPMQIADACVRFLHPLAPLGVPVASVGSVLSLALRFLPLVHEELARIRLAQRARGACFDEGPLGARIRVWASVFIPLIVGLFHRADCLAEAMAARLAEAPSANRLPEPRALTFWDWIVLATGVVLTALFFVGAIRCPAAW